MSRVLIVEDGKNVARSLERGLEAEGFEVDRVCDPSGGLSQASRGAYDAIVLDIVSSGVDGYKVCSELRASGAWTPILMVTAEDGDLDEAEALDTGADDFLSKPFSHVVLVARLRALLRRAGQPPALEVGDLRLDSAAHRCWRADTEVELTRREFALLEFLMRRADQVVSKNDILRHVWDSGFDGDPNIIEVYIGYLRRKIDAPFGRHSIRTIRLVGYRLDPG